MSERERNLALINVNVLTMQTPGILDDHVVLVRGDRIDRLEARETISLPENVEVIDGEGGFLMPGLADMHTHLGMRDPDPAHLILYLAEGVTTVRSMSGSASNPDWRSAVEEGELLGPTILTAGKVIVDGLEDVDPETVASSPVFIPESAEDAVAEVRRQAAGWPDLVKVYDGLPEAHYLAAIAAANAAGIYVAGHVLDHLSRTEIMTSGINEIAHLDELNHSHWIGTPDEPGFTLDYDGIEATSELMMRNDVAVVSNLVADEVMYRLIADADDVLNGRQYRVVRPEMIDRWSRTGRHIGFAEQLDYRRDLEMPFLKELVRSIHRAGVLVTVGTDTSTLEGSIPSNIHRELELLVESGISAFEALAAATRTAAEVVRRMGRDGAFGVVAPGHRADLMLLQANPLDRVGRTRDRIGVMVRGRWFQQARLDQMVNDFVSTY